MRMSNFSCIFRNYIIINVPTDQSIAASQHIERMRSCYLLLLLPLLLVGQNYKLFFLMLSDGC